MVRGFRIGSVGFTEGLWPSRNVGGFHGGSVVVTEGPWLSRRAVLVTYGLLC